MKNFVVLGALLTAFGGTLIAQDATGRFATGLAAGLATVLPQATKLKHPDPRIGLPIAAGVCLANNINGTLLPKLQTRNSCAAFHEPTVWVEGNRVVAFSKPARGRVATGQVGLNKIPAAN